MRARRGRRGLLVFLAVVALLLPAVPSQGLLPRPGSPTGATGAAGAKVSPALRGIVDHGLADQVYGPVVDGDAPGTVYALAQLQSMDGSTLAALRDAGATLRFRYDVIGWVAFGAPAADIAAIAALPQVVRVTEDRVLRIESLTARAADAPPAFPDQTMRGQHDVGADALWRHGVTGSGVTVGVVDSGIDSSHPDVATNLGTFVNCMTVLPDITSADPNAIVGQCAPTPGTDDNGHGTHVAGIAAGAAMVDRQLPGMAPSASLAGAKVCNGAGSCLTSSVMAGVLQLATPVADGGAGASVINISLGSGPVYAAGIFTASQETDADPSAQLLDVLADKYNVLFAVAAGNGGPTLQSVGSPSTASQALSVGASVTDWDLGHPRDETLHGQNGDVRPEAAQAGVHAISTFSSRGPSGDRQIKPDVTAPGAYIVSAEALTGGEVKAADAAVGNNYSTDPNYAVLSGTSMAAPAAAGAAALLIDGYRQATGTTPPYYVVKAAFADTAHAPAFEGSVTGLISSLESNRLGMDPNDLFPRRNDGDVGVTGEGAGRMSVPDALLASTAGVVLYTPEHRDGDAHVLTTDALQPGWAMSDVAPGQTAKQRFVVRGGPDLAVPSTRMSFTVESGPEVEGINAAPASWFTLPGDATAYRDARRSTANFTLRVPKGATPGQYAATIVGTADIGHGVTQHVRIPVQFFVQMPAGAEMTGPIWASDTTDYSIVGFESPEGGIFTDWWMVPVRVPHATTMTVDVWDEANQSTMDVFVFGGDGNEIDSTVTPDLLHAVPGGVALQPSTAQFPASVELTVGPNGEVGAGDVVWLVVSDTKPANPASFETFHLKVS